MAATIETFTPQHVMEPLGPYSHLARAGGLLWISATAGVDAATGELAGPDAYTQARHILSAFRRFLREAGADLGCIVHLQVYLKDMADFEAMDRACTEELGTHRPARTVVAVTEVPKRGARLTMSAQAVHRNSEKP